MKLFPRLIICTILCLFNATALFAQWEWFGNPPFFRNSNISSAGGRMFLEGGYSGDQVMISSDGGESWKPATNGKGLSQYCTATTGPDTLLYAIGETSKIWKSTNFGVEWTRCDSNLSRTDLNSLAFTAGSDGTANGVLLAGTTGAGVFASLDAGVHWVPVNSGLTDLAVTSLTTSDSTLFVGTASKGVFRSLDNGTSWSQASSGIADSAVEILASTQGRIFAVSGKTLYTSENNGASWTSSDASSLPSAILSLAFVLTPGKGNGFMVFAYTDAGIYRNPGNDSSWQKINTPKFSTYLGARSLVAWDSVLCYAEQKHIYRSTNLGITWDWIGQYLDPWAIWTGRAPHGETGSAIYAFNNPNYNNSSLGSLFVSTNHGYSWRGLLEPEAVLGQPIGYFECLSIGRDSTPNRPTRLMVGTAYPTGSILRSIDGGTTWDSLHSFVGNTCVALLDLDSVSYASILLTRYALPSQDSLSGLYKSTNGGTTWDKISWGAVSDSGIVDLAAFPSRAGGRTMFAGNWHHLFRSSDDGLSWNECQFATHGTGRRHLRLIDGTLYLANSGTRNSYYDDEGNLILIDDSAGVFRSTDDGLNWVDVTNNLHASFIRGFAATSLTEYPSRVFLAVSTPEGAFTSSEGGARWEHATTEGIPYIVPLPPTFFDAPLVADGDYLYLGKAGVWRLPWSNSTITTLGENPEDRTPGVFCLNQNYPNPFNPTTTITYSLPHRSHVSLLVFNILGQEVAVLLNGEIEAGAHAVQFDASQLASGVYFYRLQAGDYTQTRKLCLIK